MSDLGLWFFLQIIVPLGVPAVILLVVLWREGKLRVAGFGDYFPAEGLGYFTLTYMASTAVILVKVNKVTAGILAAYLVIFLLLGLFLSSEVQERMKIKSTEEDGAQRRGQIAMWFLVVACVIIPFLLVGDVYS